MDINEFVKHVAAQFEETDPALITADTDFKALDEWSSLMALSLIAMADEEYEVMLKGADIMGATTVRDLFDAVSAKL